MKPILLLAFANERQNNVRYLRALSDERRTIKAALDPAIRAGLCELVELPNATLPEIFATFQDGRYRDRIALFHYGGHAGSDALLLEKNDGENATAHSAGLIPFLTTQKGLEMVFLNGCNTEQWARALNEAGIPLVAGTFEAIRDQVAQQLAAQFYTGLGQGLPLRRAWDEAIARSRTESGDDLRSIGREGFLLDRFPWDLFQRKGADQANYWNLPDATGDPLAALPLPESYQVLPNEPFRLLDRYRKTDAPIFFGRGHDIRDLHDRLTNPVGSPVVLLSGQSGVGKSSLLEAGLLPRMEDRYTTLYLRRNGNVGLVATLEYALRAAPNTDDAKENLLDSWKKVELQHGKPLVCILDQAEEAFTQDTGKGTEEITAFAHLLHDLFGNFTARPKGKVLLGFRKEYEAEIEDVLKQQKIDYESVFLKRLTRSGIAEVVNGLASTPRLIQKYSLRIEEGLSDMIAADLLADSDTPISPVLQIILTKLWQDLPKGENRVFTQQEYLRLKEDGVFLGDFFRQQMEKLRTWERQVNKDVESSGLALDILNFHATDLGFANSRSMEDLQEAYQHRADVLEDLVKQFKELYLLTDAGAKRNALAHDTLAPVVLQEVKNSDRPGQKALRILTGKAANYRRNPEKTVIDEDDLALVEQGQTGMRMWVAEEPELINKSRERRAKLRRQRRLAWSALLLLGIMAAWFGYANYQKSQIERWVSQARLEASADPTIALRTLQKAIDRAPDNPAVMAALNDIWSNNEFYERVLPHPDAVKGVILAPDSSGMLYSWTEHTLYRWSGEGVKKDTFATKDITAVALSPDGLFLTAATQDGHITRLEAANLRQVQKTRPSGTEYATHLVYDTAGRTLFVAGTDTFVYMLQSNDLALQNRFKVANKVSALAAHPYGNTLLVGYVDGTGEERTTEGSIVRALGSHKDQVLSFSVSPKDSSVASAGRDAQLLFEGRHGHNTLTLKGHDRRINAIQWSPDSSRLFSASQDYLVKTWSPDGDLISVYRGHTGFVNDLSVSKDGQRFASAGEDKTVRVWKTESKVLRRYGPHPGGISGMLLSKDGKTIITASDAGLNDVSETLNDPDFNFDDLIALQFGLFPRSVLLWDALNGSKKGEWKGHKGGINAIAFDQEGKTIVTASDDSTAMVWNETGTPIRALSKNGHIGKVLGVAISPDAQYVVTVGEDSLTILWSKKGAIITQIHQNDLVHTVAFSPLGNLFATGCYDGTVRLYDVSGIEKSILGQVETPRVESLCFAPDGQSILVGRWDNEAQLYNLKGAVLSAFKVYSENKTGGQAIKSVAISPDGKQYAFGAEGGLTQVFRLVDNQPVSVFEIQHYPKRAILSLDFTPDGKGILTGSNDRWGRWWRINHD